MSDKNGILKGLKDAIFRYSSEEVKRHIDDAMELGIPGEEIRRALFLGMELVRQALMSNDTSLPEFLLTIDVMNDGLEMIPDLSGSVKEEIPVVIGVVEGDPHDIGKNIITSIYKALGNPVTDLGRDVSQGRFITTIGETGAKILALSAMMSTTVHQMESIIKEVRTRFPETAIMVGGAYIDKKIAKDYGATAMRNLPWTSSMRPGPPLGDWRGVRIGLSGAR